MSPTYEQELKNFNYPSALTLINSEIKANGISKRLLKAKLFALINMEKFTLSLSSIKMSLKCGISAQDFSFEAAYCLYRLGKFQAAFRILETSMNPEHVLLKAQCLYRLERFSESAEIFDALKNSQSFQIAELDVNLLAAKAQSGQTIEHVPSLINFDLVYNVALVYLNSKQLGLAEQYASDCAEFTNQDDVSSGDLINSQIASICALLASDANSPEAEFLLRKLKTRNDLSEAQTILIHANSLLFTKEGCEIDSARVNKSNLFRQQKKQVLVNLYRSGHDKSQRLLKAIGNPSHIDDDVVISDPKMISVASLKSTSRNAISSKTKTRKSCTASPKINENWVPLRDRSTYLPKEKYLRSLKLKKK